MISNLRAFWKILILSAEPFEDVKRASDGFWFSLKLFLLVAVIAGLASLGQIPKAVAQPTLAERIENLARRVDEAAPMAPWFVSDLLDELAAAIEEVALDISTSEPPLGVRPSRFLRELGAWLQRLLNLLASWLGMALGTWIVARLIGGSGSLRVHISLVLLAVSQLVFHLIFDLLEVVFTRDLLLVYIGWAYRLALWVWSMAIVLRALSVAHSIRIDKAIAILIVSTLVFVLLIPAMFVGLVLVVLISIF